MAKAPKEQLKERNPFFFFLLRAYFKWEVAFFYGNVSRLSMSRYVLLDKNVDSTYVPEDEKKLKEKEYKILSDASYLVRQACEKTKNTMFSDETLDAFARCIRILGKFDSWDDFVSFVKKKKYHIDYIQFGETLMGKPYEVCSLEEKNFLSRKIVVCLDTRVSIFTMRGLLDRQRSSEVSKAILLSSKRAIRPMLEKDIGDLEKIATDAEEFALLTRAQSFLKFEFSLVWVLINEANKVLGCMTLVSLGFRDDIAAYKIITEDFPLSEEVLPPNSRRPLLACNIISININFHRDFYFAVPLIATKGKCRAANFKSTFYLHTIEYLPSFIRVVKTTRTRPKKSRPEPIKVIKNRYLYCFHYNIFIREYLSEIKTRQLHKSI